MEGTPFVREEVREAGLPLIGETAVQLPNSSDWRIDRRLNGWMRRPGFDEIDDRLYDPQSFPPQRHHVGGHPAFAQFDFREPGHYDEFDRTLLRLTSDENLIWGDVGEAVFLIRRPDLIARDFSSIVFSWDAG